MCLGCVVLQRIETALFTTKIKQRNVVDIDMKTKTTILLSAPDPPVTDPDVEPPLSPSSVRVFVMSGDQWFGQLWAHMSQDSWLCEGEGKWGRECVWDRVRFVLPFPRISDHFLVLRLLSCETIRAPLCNVSLCSFNKRLCCCCCCRPHLCLWEAACDYRLTNSGWVVNREQVCKTIFYLRLCSLQWTKHTCSYITQSCAASLLWSVASVSLLKQIVTYVPCCCKASELTGV